MLCKLCPRMCNVNRDKALGYCKSSNKMHIAHYDSFFYEEPCLTGKNGSGAIFFSGCSLKCKYCQNYEISATECGKEIGPAQLIEIIKELEDKKVCNINLVTPTHYSFNIYNTLKEYKPSLPVVYNTHSYEDISQIEKMSEVVDIFLADLKYFDETLAIEYSNAPCYFEIATNAIKKMIELKPTIYNNDIMVQGVIIRVLILPGHISDTIKILEYIKDNYPTATLSIMAQYTPCRQLEYANLNRKITKREYNKVLNKVFELNLDGYCQELDSATTDFIPKWSLLS